MNDVLVTIRITEEMLSDLEKAAKADHYIDISEALRGIVRDSWLSHNDPYHEIRKLREDITSGFKEKGNKIAKQLVLDEFKKIRQGLKNED